MIELCIDLIKKFWSDEEADFDSRHITILNVVHKGKDPQHPKNHRGVALKETSAKILQRNIGKNTLRHHCKKTSKKVKQINPHGNSVISAAKKPSTHQKSPPTMTPTWT